MTCYVSEKQQAFEQQALAQSDLLYRFALRLTGNAADAEDLLQDTYLKAYRFWDTFDQGTNIRAWLSRILKTSFMNLHRKGSREPDMLDYCDTMRPTSGHHIDAEANSLQDLVFKNLLDDDVSGAVSGLTEEFRTVVILSDIEGLRQEEIARFVGCALGTVQSRLHRGRRLLRSKLYDYAKERGYGLSTSEFHRHT